MYISRYNKAKSEVSKEKEKNGHKWSKENEGRKRETEIAAKVCRASSKLKERQVIRIVSKKLRKYDISVREDIRK